MSGGTIMLSDLVREDRMDAGFHIALKSVETEVARLREHYTDTQAKHIVDSMGFDDKRRISVLMRGNSPFNAAAAAKVTTEYPHLSLALLASQLVDAVERISQRIAADQARLEELIAVGRVLENAR